MIILAYDHGAHEMFQKIKGYLKRNNIEYKEFASVEYDPLDNYTEFAKKANEHIKKGNIGIYGCRSGIGMTMASNKSKGVRGALCIEPIFAEMSRKHNNANVCVLPCDYISTEKAIEIIDTFLATEFMGGIYQIRVEELDEIS
jgi:ribose 5-phosphate isomerase B